MRLNDHGHDAITAFRHTCPNIDLRVSAHVSFLPAQD